MSAAEPAGLRLRGVVVTCEHASAAVPATVPAAARALLATHRGHDAGARELARDLARALDAPLHLGAATRLAIDLNRSLERGRAYSRWTRPLDAPARAELAERLWRPFRAAVLADVMHGEAPVLHLSVHTFTPRLGGRTRPIDVALLYDPRRPRERAFADRWLAALARLRPDLRLRRNAPYRGVADGHTTTLRRALPASRYLGIELEVSQRFPRAGGPAWRKLCADVVSALLAALAAKE